MNIDKFMTRRESIKTLLKISGCLPLANPTAWSSKFSTTARATSSQNGFIVEGIGETPDYDVKELTRKTFEAAGGMAKFISKGDVVVIKPNISWARRP